MSQTWYPIIDYDKCTGCLACYDKCTHGVFELNSKGLPKVVSPADCVQGCKSCGLLCPEDAITYLGDTEESAEECCCGGRHKEKAGQSDDSCCCDDEKSEKDCCGGGHKEESEGCCCEDEKTEKDCCEDEADNGCGCGCC